MRADGIVLALALALAIGAASAPAATAAAPSAADGISPAVAADEAQSAAQSAAWMAYLQTVLDAMRASPDAREQVLALAAGQMLANAQDPSRRADAQAAVDIAALANAHPGDRTVQWVAARHATAAGRTVAVARLQSLEPANAAVWAFSLPHPPTTGEALPTLQRMAAASGFDNGMGGVLAAWRSAFQRVPLSPDVVVSLGPAAARASQGDQANIAAIGMMNVLLDVPWQDLVAACPSGDATANDPRATACVAIGRLMLHEGSSLIEANIGKGLLRRLHAIDPGDSDRLQQLAWWQTARPDEHGPGLDAYLDDWVATGSEVEALRLASIRAGRETPPDDWQPRSPQIAMGMP